MTANPDPEYNLYLASACKARSGGGSPVILVCYAVNYQVDMFRCRLVMSVLSK